MAKLVEIPQDIIDNIIAAVGDDTHSLKQCSLVSSSFLRSSRKQLFSRITLSSDETFQGIHQFLVQNPVVQSFVRAITLSAFFFFMPNTCKAPKWVNDTSLLAILRLPFCCLECFSIEVQGDDDDDGDMVTWLSEYPPSTSWDWNCFSSEMKDALSNIILSSTLKTLCLDGITNVPTTFLLHIAHLTTLGLLSITPNDFCDETSLTPATSKGVAPIASHTVIDRCVWRYGKVHGQRPIGGLIFLPFMCRLRFLEIYLDLVLTSEAMDDFEILSFLIRSLSISLSYPEHLKFNIQFHNYTKVNSNTFDNFRNAWSHLDSITTHPNSSLLQRVDININYVNRYKLDDGAEPDKDEVLKAVLDGLPLLHRKGVLFVEAVLGK